MRTSELDASTGLFPAGVRSLSFRGVDRDLFCWVFSDDALHDRLVALPDDQDEAVRELRATLERDHHFSPDNAASASSLLFELAYQDAASAAAPADVVALRVPENAEPRRAAAQS